MTAVAANVRVGRADRTTGTVMKAVLGTALPTDATTAPNALFGDHGYISDAGLTFTPDLSTADLRDMNGDLVRRLVDTFTGSFDFAFMETTQASVGAWVGSSNMTAVPPIPGEAGELITAKINSKELDHYAWLFHLLDGVKPMRIAVADGQITSRQPLAFSGKAGIFWGGTMTTYPDASGNNAYIYARGETPIIIGSLPTVTAATPANALENAVVTLTGTNLTSIYAALVGGVAAKSVTPISATSASLVMPAGVAGSAPIRAITPGGGSVAFAYTRG